MLHGPLSPLHDSLSMIRREFDASRINAIINHPDIMPYVQGTQEGPLDLGPVVADRNNVLLMGEHGGILFHQVMPGIFEAHTQVLPHARGAWTVKMVRAALHWLFTRTLAIEAMTRCPKGNRPAKALAHAIGGEYQFTNHQGWVMNGEVIPADILSLSLTNWMRDAPGLVERGRWFHDLLVTALEREGVTLAPLKDAMGFERYMGAACEMMLNGQPDKATLFYNRWAVMADYPPISVIQDEPPVIDIGVAMISPTSGGSFDISAAATTQGGQ